MVLREIIQSLKKKFSKKTDAIAITASTGMAACNIGGVTIHSFTGAGLCNEPPEQLVAKIRRNKKSAARWVRTEVLIIDEGVWAPFNAFGTSPTEWCYGPPKSQWSMVTCLIDSPKSGNY